MMLALVIVAALFVGFVSGSVVMFRFCDREMRRRGVDITIDEDDFPKGRAIACGYDPEL